MASITFNLVCFLANVDFARNFVKYLPSKDVARLIKVSKQFTPKYIIHIIKQDYKSLYYNFISQREKYYPLIFSFNFRCHDIDTLSEYLAKETIQNLKSNQPIIYIPDKIRTFNPHDKKIREILYQCFSLYLSKPIQMICEDGTISFNEVGSIINDRYASIDNKCGKWAYYFEDGVYSVDTTTNKYDENGNLNQLGIHDEQGYFLDGEFEGLYINTLFMLLHKFDIKLKNKFIVDQIIISPFEQEIEVKDLSCKLRSDVLYPHHMNSFHGNIEENLNLITQVDTMQFYSFIANIPTGMLRQFQTIITNGANRNVKENCYRYFLNDIYLDMVEVLGNFPLDKADINRVVEYYIRSYHNNQQDLPHHLLQIKKYNMTHLLDYIDWSALKNISI